MARWLQYDDIVNVLYGATFLGGGGGGPLDTALEILEKVSHEREIRIKLLSLNDPEVDPQGYGAMIACLGSPEAMKAGTFGPDGVASFEAFKRALALEGKEVKYLYSGEMGGFNTFAPMLVALYSSDEPEQRIQFLDVDANGRAVPELNTSLNAARGYAPYPVGMGTLSGNQIIAYGVSDSDSEAIARGICGAFNNQIGFSTWAMCKDEFIDNSVVGGVTKALEVGEAIAQAKKDGAEPVAALQQLGLTCKLFAKAVIVKKETRIDHGFDCGVTTLKDIASGELFTIDFQNENLVMRRGDGSAVVTAPEIIALICRDQGENAYLPLTNASTAEGMQVDVILCPADDKWWNEDKQANTCWLPCLERVHYDGPQIRYTE